MSIEQLKLCIEEEERQLDERTLGQVASAVRIGLGSLLGCERTADAHRRRCTAAWVLVHHCKWEVAKVAKALGRTERQAWRMLSTQRTAARSPKIFRQQ